MKLKAVKNLKRGDIVAVNLLDKTVFPCPIRRELVCGSTAVAARPIKEGETVEFDSQENTKDLLVEASFGNNRLDSPRLT